MAKLKYLVSYILLVTIMLLVDNQIFIIIIVSILFLLFLNEIRIIKSELSVDKQQSIFFLEHQLKKRTKKEIELTDRFHRLTEQMKSALIIVDSERMIEYVNPIFYDYFGSNNVIGKDYTKTSINKEIRKVLNDSYLLEREVYRQIQVGIKYYDVSSIPLFEDNLFTGTIVIAHDISAIKNMEQFQKEFIADVSHELKTPVSAIKAASEIIIRDKDIDKDTLYEFINIIYKENNRMENIVSDLLDISQLDNMQGMFNLEYINIKEVIDYSMTILSGLADKKNIELIYEGEANLVGKIDRSRLKQVLINLIKNAINYTDSGYVKVIGNNFENYTEIKVIDTGIGIKEDDLERIYERFYRADRGRSRDTGGTGLGLSIVKTIVEKHQGTIEVKSVLNQGTEFIIKLPRN